MNSELTYRLMTTNRDYYNYYYYYCLKMYVKFNFLAPDCKEKTYTEIPINLFILDVI